MGQIVRQPVDAATKTRLGQSLSGYIKFVVDIDREILAAGSLRHYDDEQALLADGSQQKDLWGGGLDLETGGLDFDSMINLRPLQNNPSRELLDQSIRGKVEKIVRRLLK